MSKYIFQFFLFHFLLWICPQLLECAIIGGKSAKYSDKSDTEFCDHEHMVYRTFGADSQHILKGTRKFSCDAVPLLKKLKLSDEQEIVDKIPTKKFGKGAVFLLAANAPYYPYLRRALHSIKRIFGREQKVIGYDLGEISGNSKMMWELRQVCGLEWRQFNYSMLPADLRDVEIFSWKILLIAEVLAEYDTVIYEDTSVNYREKEPLNAFLEEIDAGRISPFQMPSETSYSIKFQTFKETYAFFPDYTNAIHPDSTNTVEEASLIIAHRSEYTKRILKWAVLCALTKDCIDIIEPSTIDCSKWTFNPTILCTPHGFHFCHLYDQTTFNLLNSNADHEVIVRIQQEQLNNKNSSTPIANNNFISRYDRSRHPRYWLQRYFFVDKRKALDPKIDFLADVKCQT